MDIEQATHEDLKKVKEKLGLKKMGDVVRMLVDHYQGPGLAVGSDEDEVKDSGEPVKRRKNRRARTAVFARDTGRAAPNAGVLHGFRPLRSGSLDQALQRGQSRSQLLVAKLLAHHFLFPVCTVQCIFLFITFINQLNLVMIL